MRLPRLTHFLLCCALLQLLAGCGGGGGGAATPSPVTPPVSTPVSPPTGVSLGGEVLSPGWSRAYLAGSTDPSGNLMGGSQIMHLVPHQGALYAAVGYWLDPSSPDYGGSNANQGWAQVLRLDSPTSAWVQDLAMPGVVRPEIVKSVTFGTDGSGKALAQPVSLLVAAGYVGNGSSGVVMYTRNDTTGLWAKSQIIGGQSGLVGADYSTRAMLVHRDTVTGVDRLFATVGTVGILSGVYDPTAAGSIRWEGQVEYGPLPVRPLAIVEANGALLFSTGSQIYRRIDGGSPTYALAHDDSDLLASGETIDPNVGGIRGLSAIAATAGKGNSLLFMWAPDGSANARGCVYRLDLTGSGAYSRTQEACMDALVASYLGNATVSFVLGAYNNFYPVTAPATGQPGQVFGLESWVSGAKLPTAEGQSGKVGGMYAGAMYGLRLGPGNYQVAEVNGRYNSANPALVSIYTVVGSPFPSEGNVLYFGGYDPNNTSSHNTAWGFKAWLSSAL